MYINTKELIRKVRFINMNRPRKRQVRQRMQITLAPKSNDLIREISDKTLVPMSNLLDAMIMEYFENHKEELLEKGVDAFYGEESTD